MVIKKEITTIPYTALKKDLKYALKKVGALDENSYH